MGEGRYLRQGLLQARLLGHGQVAHGLPAGAQLLHLHLDPRRVVVAAIGQLPRRALERLDAHRSLAQLLLENLRPSGKQRQLCVIVYLQLYLKQNFKMS